MQIRKMVIADYEEVYSLWTSCKGMGLNSLDDTKDGIARFLERNPDTCFVSLIDNRIVGAILVGSDGRRGYIYHTAVHPDFRNQGIAKAMVDVSLSAVENMGINKVALVVFGRNKIGNDFWEKMGFTTREDIIYRNKTIKEFVRIDT